MKKAIAIVLAACFVLLASDLIAQNIPGLRDIHDPLLPQLMKQDKNIRFVITTENSKPAVKFYEEPEHLSNTALLPQNTHALTTNFHLTKDINVQTDANPVNSDFIFNRPYAVLNNIMYFSANDGTHGNELWRSDGTTAGTYLLKDLVPGNTSSNPYEIITAGNKLFFVTSNSITFSYQLWVSDGTAAGTTLLKDLVKNGPGINGAYYLTNVSGTVYFLTADAFGSVIQLWKTNGTVNGTVLVKYALSYLASPLEHVAAQGLFYFTLYDPITGYELWRSDGTDVGTFMVRDISPNQSINGPYQLTPFNHKLYFSADDGSGRKLWLTDGTTAGTVVAKGAGNVTLPDNFYFAIVNKPFAIQDNNLYMQASAPATGSELYKYSTTTGFSLVKNITPGSAGGYVDNITPAFGNIVFDYIDTVTKKTGLWVTDGSSKTFIIQSYNQGTAYFDNLTPGNNLLYFTSSAGGNGYELWKTNGTSAGTVLVKDIYAGPTSSRPAALTYFKNNLYFNATSKKSGTELWQSDGSTVNTNMVAEINQSTTSYSGPDFFSGYAIDNNKGSAINNTLYFIATKPETGFELYKSDGTGAGTALASDIITGENSSYPQTFSAKYGAVYFVASTTDSAGNYLYNIYKTDSTGLITARTFSSRGYIIRYDVAENGLLYYVQYSFLTNKYELWRSDGTPGGNFMLTDKAASYDNSFPIKTIGNKAYFTATDESGNELWSSNGTVAGTKRVKDINAGSNNANPYSLYVYKNNIYFGADDDAGIALWRSSGTAAGTVKIKNIQPYGANYQYGYNDYFCIANDILYLNAYTPETGAELWKTNGTATGTVLVKDITGDATSSDPSYLTNVNGILFFSVGSSQLWKSGGTQSTTVLVKNIPSNSYNLFLVRCVADGKLFFNPNQLLWVSDGTDAGTLPVSDNGLNGVSLVTNLVAANNTVFFNGYSDKYSYELYAGDATKVIVPHLAGIKPQSQQHLSFKAAVLHNPVINTLNLKIESEKNQIINIAVSNANGNVIAQQQFTVNKGSNQLNMNAGTWQTGIYLVKLYNNTAEAISISVLK